MFKKSAKLEPPPKPPTMAEILQDLETFEIQKPSITPTRTLDPNSSYPDRQWWKAFQTLLNDVEELKRIRTELNGYRIKLEEVKLEMETTSKKLQNDIDENLEITRKEFKD